MTTPGMTTARSYPEVVPDNCSRGHSALTFCGAMNNGTAERAQLCRCFAADYELFIERSPAAALRQLRDRMRIPAAAYRPETDDDPRSALVRLRGATVLSGAAVFRARRLARSHMPCRCSPAFRRGTGRISGRMRARRAMTSSGPTRSNAVNPGYSTKATVFSVGSVNTVPRSSPVASSAVAAAMTTSHAYALPLGG